ncbi:hypothetical protein [Lacinutrix jangbogonensis]|uniref:hypothetical protein n=1 Tax=Lacinutrix jangbogonensis TaxID=1469557 RepID=UPI000B169931|nr:hypothetical protein [Lacinutrix jangbogonensis]
MLCIQSDSPEFSWHENHKLKWTDFEGEPDMDSSAAAVTASGITFSYSIQKSSTDGITGFQTKAFAHFYPEESWCKKDIIDNHILKHEQFHFNITELNVRYFREKVSKLKISSSIENQLDDLNNQINENLGKMQKLYDAESNYSINKECQARWVIFVKKELKRLEKYKSK